MSSMEDDIDEAITRAIDGAKTQTVWSGTIITTNPLTVQLDGSGVAIECLAGDFVSIVEQRRCIVQQVGAQLVVTTTFGQAQLNTLTVATLTATDRIDVPLYKPVYGVGGSDSSLSLTSTITPLATPAYAVFTAPPTQDVLITLNARIYNVTNAGTGCTIYVSYEVRTGSTVGSGTLVVSHQNGRAIGIRTPNADYGFIAAGRTDPFTLTAGAVYNAQVTYWAAGDPANTYVVDSARLYVYPQFQEA